MLYADPLTGASSGLTWLAQSTCAFFIVWSLCSILRSPRVRVWLWSVFIAGAVFSWLAFGLRLDVRPPTPGLSVATSIAVSSSESSISAEGATASPIHQREISALWSFEFKHNARWQSLAKWSGLLYLCTAGSLVVIWFGQFFRLKRLFRGATDAPPELQAIFRQLSHDLGIDSCRLRTSPFVHSPATAGWLRPQVLVPNDLLHHVSEAEMMDMLRHELIHVRRRDYLWERLAALAARVVFFHPAVWFACRDLHRQREMSCDHEAAGCNLEDRLRYADSLLSFARWRQRKTHPTLALQFAAVASPLAARVHSLLLPPVANPRRNLAYTTVSIVIAFCLLTALAPFLRIGFRWAADNVAVHSTAAVETVPVMTAATVVRKTHHSAAMSIRAAEPIPVIPPAAPDSRQLAAITDRLANPAVPVVAPKVSFTSLAKAQISLPSYTDSAALRTRRMQAEWNAPAITAPTRRPRQLGPIGKTAFSAAVYGLTYAATEAVETERPVTGPVH